MSSTPLPPELSQALDAIRPWLQDLGYSLSLDPDTSSFTDGKLGEYELGSVFEKDIVIRVSPRNIRKAIREYPEAFETFPKEVRFTVFHEVGHALVEQLVDYVDNIEDFLPNIEAKYGEKFFDVFDDENITEEELVEDFARAFGTNTQSVLQECAEKCLCYD